MNVPGIPAESPRLSSVRPCKFPKSGRLLLLVSGAMLGGLLAVAGMLKPDSRGLGTHEQLGLPPCAIQALFQIPCPSCGMTTSWARLMRADITGSLNANPAGTTAAVIAMLLSLGMISSGWNGRWSRLIAAPRFWLAVVLGQGMVMLVFWVCRIAHWA